MRLLLAATFLGLNTLLSLVGAGSHPKPKRRLKGCVRGDIAYAAATYRGAIDVKGEYALKFDQLTCQPLQRLLCSSKLKGLPVHNHDSIDGHSHRFIQQNYLEPLFINLTTLNGLYGMRSYGRVSVKFRCGYSHKIVLIANNQYYPFERDTVFNKQLIEKLLSSDFIPEEIKRMQQEYNSCSYCNDFTFMPPEIIRRNKELLFNLHAI